MKRFTGKIQLLKLLLGTLSLIGGYWLLAWISYSPLDNSWTTASSFEQTINITGALGAWLADVSLALFGYPSILLPLAMLLVPIYLIAFKQIPFIQRDKVLLWLASFALFLLGVCGLLNVMIGSAETYHAGGILGVWLSQLIDPLLGQLGVLLFALIFLSIGFYYCSGQVLLELAQLLYEWILNGRVAKQETTESPAEPTSVEKETQMIQTYSSDMPLPETLKPIQHLEQDLLETTPMSEPVVQPQILTDLSTFIRPNIIGLKTENHSQEPVTLQNMENASTLPKINFEDTPPFLQKNNESYPLVEQTSVESTVVEQATVKQSRINQALQALVKNTSVQPPVVEQPVEEELFIPQHEVEKMLPKVSLTTPNAAPTVQAKSIPIETNQMPLEPISVQPAEPKAVPNKSQGIFPEIKLHQEMIDQADSETQKRRDVEKAQEAKQLKNKQASMVVHPLLQRQNQATKPTTPLPTLDLLDKHAAEQQRITEQEIRETSARIEKELANFGVKATVEDVLVGPVVTRYEILPASGVKAAKITNLDTDLARALIFKAIRITDVVPGKPYMGIETPNKHRETVWLRDVLDSNEFRQSNAILPMALGKDISGNPVVVDMAKMPHLLVAGQTGGGKSVGVNTMILSLLFKLTPEQVRFIMIDPKVVELSIYNDIPHLLTPVVTDMKKAENALRWVVEEMEHRYQLLSYLQVRTIEKYNDKIEEAESMNLPIKNPYWKPSDSMDLTAPPLKKMSYIVVIIDEFADLMMSTGKQAEEHIVRLAQKARAIGIHLILATQRPSTDVITGIIKANIPSRIAFTVSSQIDSRTILDKGGAEALLGRGDMLYSGASSPEIIRIHGAFMSDDEVQRVADNWRARGKPEYIENIVATREEENGLDNNETSGDLDPLFDEIAAYVLDTNVTSISGIQRRFSIGFNRAARIIDQLTEQGLLSEPDNRGKREVLMR